MSFLVVSCGLICVVVLGLCSEWYACLGISEDGEREGKKEVAGKDGHFILSGLPDAPGEQDGSKFSHC